MSLKEVLKRDSFNPVAVHGPQQQCTWCNIWENISRKYTNKQRNSVVCPHHWNTGDVRTLLDEIFCKHFSS